MPKIIVIEPDGTRRELDAPVGKSLMQIGRDAGLDIEGACDGAMACSTCHVYVDPAWAAKLPKMGEDESDMLDLAFGVTDRSRLGCQIVMTEELDGLTVALPKNTRNALLG
jgi:ferredoxin, 2Fe-2S